MLYIIFIYIEDKPALVNQYYNNNKQNYNYQI